MYAKLINGTIRSAPKKAIHNNRMIFNPPEEVLKESGYLPVTYVAMPTDAPEGQHYESSWQQGENDILQVWSLVEDPVIPEPELSADEALAIIMGVTE